MDLAWTHIVMGSTVVRSVICVVDKFVAMTVTKLLVMVVELVRGKMDLLFIVQMVSIWTVIMPSPRPQHTSNCWKKPTVLPVQREMIEAKQ